MDFGGFSDFLKVVLQICQVVALFYAGYKFTRKPHDTLENRVSALEEKNKDMELELLKKDERIRELEELCGVIIRSVIALIEFEMQYCLTEHKDMSDGLKKAKEDLHNFLSDR